MLEVESPAGFSHAQATSGPIGANSNAIIATVPTCLAFDEPDVAVIVDVVVRELAEEQLLMERAVAVRNSRAHPPARLRHDLEGTTSRRSAPGLPCNPLHR
jgi:hypothetical protein